MLPRLVAGSGSKVLAQLARRSMRAKITVLEQAFTGHFTDHHAFLLGTMLGRVDAISADIAALDDRIAAQAAPLATPWPAWMRSRGSAWPARMLSSPRSAPT